MKRLSIIVPAYNVGKYIEKCIRSLYSQDLNFAEYEVIVVDDGSPDNLHFVVENLQKEFENLVLIRQENKHLGGARNTGIQVAQGKYILFVDSDDYILPNTLAYLLDKAENESLDVLRTKFATSENPNTIGEESPVLPGIVFLKEYGIYHSVCLHLVKKSLLIENNIFFREKTAMEDGDFSSKITFFAQRIQHISFTFYVYAIRKDSITQTPKLATFVANVLLCQAISEFNESVVKQKDIEAYKVVQKGIEDSLRSYPKISLNYSLKDIITASKTVKKAGFLQILNPARPIDKIYKLLIICSPVLYAVLLHSLKFPVFIYRLRHKLKK